MGNDESPNASNQFTKRWIIFASAIILFGLGVIVLLLLVTCNAEQTMETIVTRNLESLIGRVKDRSRILIRVNSSAFAIANTLRGNKIKSFSDIENKIAPALFITFSTLPLVSQVSYIGADGFAFSYYREHGNTAVIFSNTSNSHSFYTQPADPYTGNRYKNAVNLKNINSKNGTEQWFKDSLNGKLGYASVGCGVANTSDRVILFTASVGKFGVVSIGVGMDEFLSYVSGIGFNGGHFLFNINSTYVYMLNRSWQSQDFMSFDRSVSNYDRSNSVRLANWSTSYKNSAMYLEIPGIQMVFTVALPDNRIKKEYELLKILIVSSVSILVLCLIFTIIVVVRLLKRSQVQESLLRADLIKQKELLKEEERKRKNTSMSFARASHDIRTSLGGLNGMIDISLSEKTIRYLEQMKACSLKLLEILNSVLDTSKVESGKMQLEETEFDIAQVLEESVDMLNVSAVKKSLEIMWDPCDFSVLKIASVRGDCQRLKQIIDNLLNNAIKFTMEGRIVLRAWARKPNLKYYNISSKFVFSFWNKFGALLKLLFKNRENGNDVEILGSFHQDPNSIELIFEVDDTGIGIPVEKRASVFENYVQVKEPSNEELSTQGTGLGLGIVQSFVRLMGGDISIQDKDPGEKGTCFRFNIFLKTADKSYRDKDRSIIRSLEFREIPSVKRVHSLLFSESHETKKILQKWFENLGIKVWATQNFELLLPTLEKIKHNVNSSSKSDSILFHKTFAHNNTPSIERLGFLSTREKTANTFLPSSMRNNSKKPGFGGTPLYILAMVDLAYEDLLPIYSNLKDFIERNPYICCMVICLANLNTSDKELNMFRQLPCDLILQKPIHGSRLHSLLKLIKEIERMQEGNLRVGFRKKLPTFVEFSLQNESNEAKEFVEKSEKSVLGHRVDPEKPLSGMKILLVEDNKILQIVGKKILLQLGATVELAENGLAAVHLIKEALENGIKEAQRDRSNSFAYDIVLMDCEMPIMDGYEATRQIRDEEKRYGIHVPIIALTAHAMPEEEKKSVLAGMDLHLTKPLDKMKLSRAIYHVCENKKG